MLPHTLLFLFAEPHSTSIKWEGWDPKQLGPLTPTHPEPLWATLQTGLITVRDEEAGRESRLPKARGLPDGGAGRPGTLGEGLWGEPNLEHRFSTRGPGEGGPEEQREDEIALKAAPPGPRPRRAPSTPTALPWNQPQEAGRENPSLITPVTPESLHP